MRGVQGAGSGGTPRARVRGGVQRADPSAGRRGPPVGGEARLTISVRPLGSPRRAAAQPGEGLVVGDAGGPNNPPANPPGSPPRFLATGVQQGLPRLPPKRRSRVGTLPRASPSLCASSPGPSPRSMTQRATRGPPLHPRTRARRCLCRHFRAPEPGSRAPGQSQERGHRIGVAALRGLRLGFPARGWSCSRERSHPGSRALGTPPQALGPGSSSGPTTSSTFIT